MTNRTFFRGLLLSIVFVTSFSVFENETAEKTGNRNEETIRAYTIEPAPVDEWDAFIEAVIWRESRGVEDILGDSGRAVGVLQIHPIMVAEANRILEMRNDPKRFSLEDRYDRGKSKDMFNIVQNFYNRNKDYRKALDIWNPGHPDEYRESIMKKFDELTLSGRG